MLKVLTNEFQASLEMHERWAVKGIGRAGRGEEFEFWNEHYYKRHPVVFNRVGHYLDGDDCWWEFKKEDGTFVGIKADAEMFKYHLKTKNAEENPIGNEDWEVIKKLLDRRILKWTPQFRAEADRRRSFQMMRDMSRHLMGFKKRVKAKIAEKKVNKSE